MSDIKSGYILNLSIYPYIIYGNIFILSFIIQTHIRTFKFFCTSCLSWIFDKNHWIA